MTETETTSNNPVMSEEDKQRELAKRAKELEDKETEKE